MNYPNLNIDVFLDGALKDQMLVYNKEGFVKGFTTNPTLMAKAGVVDYAAFAREVLREITDKPISFEVFSDEFPEMERQAEIIAGWGDNVNVKIPITNTKQEPSYELIGRLLEKGIKLNVTAVFTMEQMRNLREVLKKDSDLIVSVFAGRIADTGVDPMPAMREAVELYKDYGNVKVLWASPREVLNVYQAAECGCHIITATGDLIKKLSLHGKSLSDFSRETVQMFYDDGEKAGFSL